MLKRVYPNSKTFIIPNGIDLNKYKNISKQKNKLFYKKYCNSINRDSNVIISLGRYQKVKGFDILIDAFYKIKKRNGNSYLFIAGEDYGEKEYLKNKVSRMNLSDSVCLLDFIEGEEKINYLKNADLFALASYHESYGLVYAEALAAGTPIIASKNTPWEDAVKYRCGKWVENTSQHFAEAINNIMHSDISQLGQNGISLIKEKYNLENTARKFQSIITNYKILNE